MAVTFKNSDRSTLAVTIAVALAALTLKPGTQDWGALVLGIILVVALGAVDAVLRRMRMSDWAVLGVNLVVSVAFLFAVSFGSAGAGNPLRRFWDLFGHGINHIGGQQAPLSSDPGARLLFVTVIALVFMVVEWLTNAVATPAWTLVPLAMPYLAVALILDMNPLWFLLVAMGYVAILLAEGINSAERWPRGVRRSSADRRSGPLAWRIAGAVVIPTLALSALLAYTIPMVMPATHFSGRERTGEKTLMLKNPALDLRRNINQPQNRTVISYTTDQPKGAYLRMASLPVFNDTGWQLANMTTKTGTDLPPAAGYRNRPGQIQRQTQLQVHDFRTSYLPLPYATEDFSAPGEWKYDPESLTVMAPDTETLQQIREVSYSVKSIDIEPDGPGLAAADSGNPPDAQLTRPIPQDLPPEIVNKALELTANQQTPALKAAAIQAWLRGGEFQYSTEPQVGSGYQALSDFLFRDKKGYCEQYAASMAIMARVVGIPSRVAVGFLPGEKRGDHYEVTIRDMHAWPELWFDGYGWVRFEPTPSIASPPAWTVASQSNSGGATDATPTMVPEQTVAPSPEPSPTPEAEPSQVPVAQPGSPFPWRQALTAGGIVALLAALVASPMLLRSRRRDKRLDMTGEPAARIEAAWDEITDTVIDHGRRWPAGTPRVIGRVLAHDMDPRSARAMRTLALFVERARYARHVEPEVDLVKLVLTIRAGIIDAAEFSDRAFATWWPRSLWLRLFRRL